MRLSELGELGLLAELERRGLISGVEHDAAQLGGGVVVTQDALVEGVHFRLDWLSWRELGFRAAAVNLSDLAASGAKPEALVVALAAARRDRGCRRRRALRGTRRAGRAGRGRRHDRGSAGRAQRHGDRPRRRASPAGRAPGPATSSSSPGRSAAAGAAFRARPLRAAAAEARGGERLAARRTRDDGHLRRDRRGRRPHRPPLGRPLRDRARPGAARARRAIDDLGFGEDYELLAAVAEPGRLPGRRPGRGGRRRRAAPARRPVHASGLGALRS